MGLNRATLTLWPRPFLPGSDTTSEKEGGGIESKSEGKKKRREERRRQDKRREEKRKKRERGGKERTGNKIGI